MLFIILGIIIFIVFVLIIFNKSKTNEISYNKFAQENFGKLGENQVSIMLNVIKAKCGCYVINDFTFKDDYGYSTNIDHILISSGGIFVIETKSNKGIIYGNKNEELWVAKKKEYQENKCFKNPIIQNQGHINHLKRMLGEKAPKMWSIIIFPYADISNVHLDLVFDIGSAHDFLINKVKEQKYSKEFIEKIYNQIIFIKEVYGISIEEHKENIKSKYN